MGRPCGSQVLPWMLFLIRLADAGDYHYFMDPPSSLGTSGSGGQAVQPASNHARAAPGEVSTTTLLNPCAVVDRPGKRSATATNSTTTTTQTKVFLRMPKPDESKARAMPFIATAKLELQPPRSTQVPISTTQEVFGIPMTGSERNSALLGGVAMFLASIGFLAWHCRSGQSYNLMGRKSSRTMDRFSRECLEDSEALAGQALTTNGANHTPRTPAWHLQQFSYAPVTTPGIISQGMSQGSYQEDRSGIRRPGWSPLDAR